LSHTRPPKVKEFRWKSAEPGQSVAATRPSPVPITKPNGTSRMSRDEGVAPTFGYGGVVATRHHNRVVPPKPDLIARVSLRPKSCR